MRPALHRRAEKPPGPFEMAHKGTCSSTKSPTPRSPSRRSIPCAWSNMGTFERVRRHGDMRSIVRWWRRPTWICRQWPRPQVRADLLDRLAFDVNHASPRSGIA